MEEERFDLKEMSCYGLPYEFYSKKFHRWIGTQLLEEARDDLKELSLNADSDLAVVMQIVGEVLTKPNYVKEHAAELAIILPILYQSDVDFTTQTRKALEDKELPVEVLKNMLPYWGYMQCCRQYLSRATSLMGRSDYVSKIPKQSVVQEDESDETYIDTLKDKIELVYSSYLNRLKMEGFRGMRAVSANRSLIGRTNQDFWLVPCLPAVFILNIVNRVADCAKAQKDLLSLKSLQAEREKAFAIHGFIKANRELKKELCTTLKEEMRYYPVRYPDAEKISANQNNNVCEEEKERLRQEQRKHLLARDIPFALPVCKIRKLAMDLAELENLNPEQTMILMGWLPNYLYGSRATEGETKQHKPEIGEKGRKILKIFRELVSPEYYNCKGGDSEYIFKVQKALKNLQDNDFLSGGTVSDLKIHDFLNKYFVYVDVTEWLVFAGSPVSMLTDYPKLGIPYLDKQYSAFRDKFESQRDRYIKNHIKSDCKDKETDLNAIAKEAVRRMTLTQALDFLQTILECDQVDAKTIWKAMYNQMKNTQNKLPEGFAEGKVTDSGLFARFPDFWDQAAKQVSRAGMNVLFRASLYFHEVKEYSGKNTSSKNPKTKKPGKLG